MKLRIALLALATCLIMTETSNAQRGGRGGPGGGRGGIGRGGFGGGFGGARPGVGIRVGGGIRIGGGIYRYAYRPYRYGGYGVGIGYYGSGGYYSAPGGYYSYSSNYYAPNTYTTPSNLVTPASYNTTAPSGLRITEIAEGSPARKAGLRVADFITSVGGTRIESAEDLQRALANANGEVEVGYLAGGTMNPGKARVTPQAGKIGVTVVGAVSR